MTKSDVTAARRTLGGFVLVMLALMLGLFAAGFALEPITQQNGFLNGIANGLQFAGFLAGMGMAVAFAHFAHTLPKRYSHGIFAVVLVLLAGFLGHMWVTAPKMWEAFVPLLILVGVIFAVLGLVTVVGAVKRAFDAENKPVKP